jgi:CheY-like chemotaxis protein
LKRVLIAEDDDRLAEILSDVLQRQGYETVTVPDGLAALGRLQTEAIDLLILDINMPLLGGASLVTRLRGDPDLAASFAELPIVIVSGMLDVVTFDLPVQGAFTKPFPIAAVAAKVRELIGAP